MTSFLSFAKILAKNGGKFCSDIQSDLTLEAPTPPPDTLTADAPVDLSANRLISWSWQDPSDFVHDMKTFNGCVPSMWTKEELQEMDQDISGALSKKWRFLNNQLNEQRKTFFDSTAESIKIQGSNKDFGGTSIQELGWEFTTPIPTTFYGLSRKVSGDPRTKIFLPDDSLAMGFHGNEFMREDLLLKGELTAPLVEVQDEQGAEDETQWFCKGCSKYFATKASLKRHHERKKSCKELSVKPFATEVALPDKPYVVDWVEGLLSKAISGDSDKPYCKHCEIEFANKTNLNKHLSKSVACDKLAKQEFVKQLKE